MPALFLLHRSIDHHIKKGFGVNQNPLVSLPFSSPALPGSDIEGIISDSEKPPLRKRVE